MANGNTTETWLPLPKWEGFYEVSNRGRVRSVAREIHCKNGVIKQLQGRELTPASNGNGYLKVCLSRPGKKEQRYIHDLVLETFVEPRPAGLQACHADDARTNNSVENLRWDTHTANAYDKVRNGGHPLANKTHCIRGHEFTPDNIYWTGNGRHRHCKKCTIERNARYRAQAKAR